MADDVFGELLPAIDEIALGAMTAAHVGAVVTVTGVALGEQAEQTWTCLRVSGIRHSPMGTALEMWLPRTELQVKQGVSAYVTRPLLPHDTLVSIHQQRREP